MDTQSTPKRVLVVDDEPLIALSVAAECEAAGFAIAGVAASVPEALRLIGETGCEIAIVDVNLRGASAEPVLAALRARGIPFIIVSGYTSRQLPSVCAGAPFLSKPYASRELIARLRALAG